MVNSGDLQYRYTHCAYLAYDDLVLCPKDFSVYKEDDPFSILFEAQMCHVRQFELFGPVVPNIHLI